MEGARSCHCMSSPANNYTLGKRKSLPLFSKQESIPCLTTCFWKQKMSSTFADAVESNQNQQMYRESVGEMKGRSAS